MADIIPFGQPILIGHHSENRDRNYRARLQRRWMKAAELREKASYYRRRASSVVSNNSVSSDDPEAVEKLLARAQKLEILQSKMKAANAALRKNDLEALRALGFSDLQVQQLKTPDFAGRIGFPDYALRNNGANLRRLKERAQLLEVRQGQKTQKIEKDGVRIVDNVEENRLQLFFPGKPEPEVIEKLKAGGFRWTPSVKCWQRFRSGQAIYQANLILDFLPKKEVSLAAC